MLNMCRVSLTRVNADDQMSTVARRFIATRGGGGVAFVK